MSVKKLMAFLLLVVLVITGGCGGKESSGSDTEGSNSGSDNEEVTLNFWTWYPSQEVWESKLQKFEEKYPNINVELSVYQSQDYQQKLPVALSTGEELDVVAVQANLTKQLESFVEPMDEMMNQYVGDDWESKFKEQDLKWANQMEDKMVFAPVGAAGSMVLYYNVAMLEELGLGKPETYEDLKEIASVLKEKKSEVLPVSFGGKEAWISDEIVLTLVGQQTDLYNRIRYDEGGSFDSPEYIAAVENFKKLFDDGIFTEEVLDLDYSRSLQVFAQGEAAMFIQGTWESYLISEPYRKQHNIDLDSVGVTAMPSMYESGTPSIRSFIDMGMAVPSQSKNKEAAMKFIEYFTLGEGADSLGDDFILMPSKKGHEAPEENLTTESAQESYIEIQALISNPSSDRNNTSFTTFVGQKLQSVILQDVDIKQVVKEIQAEHETGKYQ
jgi:raffinose/stachyose/melibiose transport system substrate-binding protein